MSRYSIDFRQKIVTAYQSGEGSIRMIAKRFLVSPETVRRLLNQHRLTGDLTPQKCGSRKKSVLSQHQDVALKVVEEHPDWTLRQYCEFLIDKLGVNVSTSMMDRFCREHNLTLKKNVSERESHHSRSATNPSRVLGKD